MLSLEYVTLASIELFSYYPFYMSIVYDFVDLYLFLRVT